MGRLTPNSSSVSNEHRSEAVAQEYAGGIMHSTKGCFEMEVLAGEDRHATATLLDVVLIFNDATAELAAASVRVSSLCTLVQWVTLLPGHSRWQEHPRCIWYHAGGMHLDLSQPSRRPKPF